ncbi:ABC-2 type transport system ATP-binding protein [Thiohalospira halophila DSM 15071]|uniref:ABC-2 type transport system ATP-binding protein n=1 Tax=Thiohalospira halophila DSM 15071 TaxID=1123397 RepID=A0A1I1Q4N2_9GAMM|nr:ABC transporter ATP-binding protein [Thiohalospira halophila]SFD17116.1 ABC-2 type transport system ATP-binding protein [Thiohalospira halophila DSM 15071]
MTIPAVTMEGVAKDYPGGRTGLAGVDLAIPEGAFFGLLGPNGAGKTTLIGLLTSLLRHQAGTIRVFGHDVVRQPVAARRLIGLVPQEVNFNSFEPVGEIVETQAAYYGLSPRQARQRTGEVLARLGLADRRHQTAWGLSGGLKRRLMLARALVHQPRLLVLDEPTAGLDLAARHDLWALLRELNADGVTILLTTHYLEEAEELCRELAIIDGGELIARGTTGDLLRSLDHQTLVLELAVPTAELPVLADAAVRRVDDHTLELDIPRGTPVNQPLADLHRQGVTVAGLRNRSNRLEALFLELTGGGQA